MCCVRVVIWLCVLVVSLLYVCVCCCSVDCTCLYASCVRLYIVCAMCVLCLYGVRMLVHDFVYVRVRVVFDCGWLVYVMCLILSDVCTLCVRFLRDGAPFLRCCTLCCCVLVYCVVVCFSCTSFNECCKCVYDFVMVSVLLA